MLSEISLNSKTVFFLAVENIEGECWNISLGNISPFASFAKDSVFFKMESSCLSLSYDNI